MKSTIAILILITLLLTGCNAKDDSDSSIDTSSVSSVVSEIISSEVSSTPVSSEPSSEEETVTSVPVSSKEASSSKPASTKPKPSSSEPPASSDDVDLLLKDRSTPTNAYVKFAISDVSGNLLSGVTTYFGFDFIPILPESSRYASYDRRNISDENGATSTNILKQDLTNKISTVSLTYDKPYKATLITPDGKEYVAESSKNANGMYNVRFGEKISVNSLGISVSDDSTINFSVIIEIIELAE